MSIFDLKWGEDRNEVSWKDDNSTEIMKRYREPVQSVSLLTDGSGVVIVESYRERGPRNAVIINQDGSERCRLPLPFPDGSVYGYYYIYHEDVRLKAVIATTSGDFRATVDPQTGTLSDLQETR